MKIDKSEIFNCKDYDKIHLIKIEGSLIITYESHLGDLNSVFIQKGEEISALKKFINENF